MPAGRRTSNEKAVRGRAPRAIAPGGRAASDLERLNPTATADSELPDTDDRGTGRQRPTRPLPARRTLRLCGLLVAGGLVLLRGVVASSTPGADAGSMHWWMLAPLFAAAELLVFHIEIEHEAHTFTLSEIPFVLALFFASPVALIVGRLVGEAVVLVLYERQTPVKLAFNLSMFFAECCVALSVFSIVIRGRGPLDPLAWFVALLSVAGADALGVAAVWLVIRWHGGTENLRRLVTTGLVTLVCNTSIAVLLAIALKTKPASVVPLAVLAAIMVGAYRGYTSLTNRYASLKLLYDFTKVMSEATQPDTTLEHILEQTRHLLRAESATVTFAETAESPPIQITRRAEPRTSEQNVPISLPDALHRRVVDGRETVVIARTTKRRELRAALTSLGVSDCLVAPLVSGGSLIGTILVANRLTEVSTFDAEDGRLFSTLASQAGVALENGRLIERLQVQAREREHDALHDSLTGLPNRAHFYREVDRAFEADPARPLAVLLMDLDRFKEINDTLGHHTGDRILEQISNRLTAAIDGRGMVARLGGDEFAILIPDIASSDDVAAIAARMRDAAMQPTTVATLTLAVGASVGVALSPQHGTDISTLLQRADIAMYQAKHSRDHITFYDPELDWSNAQRLTLATELRAALDDDNLEVHYQPVARMDDAAIVSAEALVRWRHPELGWLPPDEFIPVAERTGLIEQLTMVVLNTALRQCAAWNEAGLDLGVSVNLPVQALLDLDWPAKADRMLHHYRVSPDRLTLEITETGIMSDPARMIGVLNAIAGRGIRLTIDDFGTGYSSLAYLQRLPVEGVKIDKSFTLAMTGDPGAHSIVSSVIDLARSLGLDVVAEGVEDQRTWDTLRTLGCGYAQGYYLSRPITPTQLGTWLHARTPTTSARTPPPPRGRPPITHRVAG